MHNVTGLWTLCTSFSLVGRCPATFRCVSLSTHLNPFIRPIAGLCGNRVHEEEMQSFSDLLDLGNIKKL